MKTTLKHRMSCMAIAATLLVSAFSTHSPNVLAIKKARLATKKMTINIGSKKSIVIKNKNKKAKYSYSSSKSKIASVSKNGIVTGKTKGSAKITVKEKLNKSLRKVGIINVTVNKKKTIRATATPVITTTNTPEATNIATDTPAPKATTSATAIPTIEPEPTLIPTRTPLVLDDTSTPSDFMTKKDGVEYGSRSDITYHSTTTDTERHAIILTPPDYDADTNYPVLYLCHGGNGDENDWLGGNPDIMLGNLLATEEAVPMIMVLVNCRARANDGPNPSDSLSDAHMQAWTDFLFELQNDLMPYMEDNFPILTGRENTAIAGLSMGGRESLYIGFNIPDKIKYIGAFSPAFGIFEYTNFGYYEQGYFTEDTFTLPEEYMYNTTCMIMNGANDSMVRDEPERYHNALVNNGVNHYYYTIPGDHNMDVWSNGLYNFLKVVFK